MTPSSIRTRAALVLLTPIALMGFAACSSDDDSGDDTTTTTAAADDGGSSTTTSGESSAEVKAFDREVQQELIDVGCYSGAVDGEIGPETDKAIEDFQKAEGLTVDGEVGPQTQAALTAAANAGTQVCGGSDSSSTTSGESSTTTSTGGGGGTAPCTATAITAALPSGASLDGYVCSEGYAGGTYTEDGAADVNFILESVDGSWQEPGQDPCGTASAGIPPEILNYCEAS